MTFIFVSQLLLLLLLLYNIVYYYKYNIIMILQFICFIITTITIGIISVCICTDALWGIIPIAGRMMTAICIYMYLYLCIYIYQSISSISWIHTYIHIINIVHTYIYISTYMKIYISILTVEPTARPPLRGTAAQRGARRGRRPCGTS